MQENERIGVWHGSMDAEPSVDNTGTLWERWALRLASPASVLVSVPLSALIVGCALVALSYERALWGAWSGGIEAQLVRYDADPAPDESRVRRQLLGQVAYDFRSSRLAVAQLERSYRPGVLSATVATVGFQWAMGRSAAGPMLGVLSLSHGLSSGLQDDTIEFDLCLRF